MVWANTFNRFDPTSRFGGYKESGFGREGGRQGLEIEESETPVGTKVDLNTVEKVAAELTEVIE